MKLDPICSVKLTKMVMPSIAGTVKELPLVQEDDLTFSKAVRVKDKGTISRP